ncbi:hypothetical protein [Streptomyces sp. CA-111067]|uniref:hypothetical protein n=1 Tax=Streptomyces sp. CA-111067 TaxID=3240046 RepID=UPI003D9996B7
MTTPPALAPTATPTTPPPTTAPPANGSAPPPGNAPPAGDPSSATPPGADKAADANQPGGGQDANAAGATGRPGQGSKRRRLQEEARIKVEGDSVAGDKIYVNGTWRQVRPRPVPDAYVQAARHAFHPPPHWAELYDNAWRKRSMVLRGPAGCGKTAAALRLLLKAGACSWHFLDSVADLGWLTDVESLGERPGLLVTSPQDAAELREARLEGLEDMLEKAGAHLVLTVGSEPRLDRDLAGYLKRLARPEDLRDVLLAHLVRRVSEREAAELLAGPEAAALIADHLGENAACRTAALAADVLADEHLGGALDWDRVRALIKESESEDPETRFEQLADPVLRTHAVALAVLNGLPQEDIALAGAALLRRFEPEGRVIGSAADTDQLPRVRDPFALSHRHELERLRARTSSGLTRGEFGDVPCTVIEYRDGGDPSRLIRHVWTEYRAQQELLAWLGELVDSGSDQILSFAGTALGLIASVSFDLLSARVFPQWIADRQHGRRRRDAVAHALRVCVRNPELRPGVSALVDAWFMSGQWESQAAAARAYGRCLGGADLTAALEGLSRLGTVGDVAVDVAVGDSFADLIEEDLAGNAPLVLRTLVRMVAEPETRECGHLSFLILADTLVIEDAEPAPGASAASRPTLMHLSMTDERLRGLLAQLWSEVICGELYGDLAAGVLTSWAAQSEADPQLLDAFVRIMRDLAQRDTRTRELLLRYAVGWDARGSLRPLHRAAALLRSVLNP